VPRDGVLPGRSVLLNLSGESPEAMVLKQPAALHLHMATLTRVYPASLMGTVAYTRQSLADARHYRDEWEAYRGSPRGRKRPRYDAGLEAWQDVVAGRLPLVVNAPRENDLRRALALADEFQVKVIAAGALRASQVAGLVKARALPLLVSVNYDPPQAPAFGGFGGGGLDEEKQRREIEEAERNPAALHKAGVPFALVSGHATDFLAGVRKAVERGLPAEEALRAVTIRPAEILGLADRLGTLEAGKIANVVVWPGDPMAKGAARPKMVFVDGHLSEPEERGKTGDGAEPKGRVPEGEAPEARPVPQASPAASPGPAPSPVSSPVAGGAR
jgi:imidazolonepropionase-like amidohydrolase